MGRYFVKAIDDALLPDGKTWLFAEEGGDAFFCVGRTGGPVEIPPEVLDDLRVKVEATYAKGCRRSWFPRRR